MALPEQVMKQAEEAELNMEADVKALAAPVDSAPVAAEGDVQPAITAPVEAQPQAPEPVAAQVPAEDFQQKLADLQAKYDHEKHRNDSLEGRIESQLRARNAEVKEMKEMIAAMQAGMPKAPVVPPHLRHVKAGELDGVDEGILDFQARVAKGEAEAVMEAAIAKLDARFKAIEASAPAPQVESVHTQPDANAIWARVESVHPGARQMDADKSPEWLAFLGSDGGAKFNEGKAALQFGNSAALIGLVSEFKARSAAGQVPQPRIAPRTASVPQAAGSPAPVKMMSADTFLQMQSQVTKNPSLTRDREFMKKWNEYEEAAEQGRLR